MKILLLSQEFPPKVGGAGTYAQNISVGMASEGHEITVLTVARPGYAIQEASVDKIMLSRGVKAVKRVAFVPKLYLLKLGWYCKMLLTQQAYDALLIADSGGQKAVALTMKRFSLPVWTVFHGSEIINYFHNQSRIFKLFGGERRITRFFQSVTGCIVISDYLSCSIKNQLSWLGDKIHVVNHGIDIEAFERVHELDRSSLRLRLGLPEKDKLIFVAGRLIREKGQDDALDWLSEILNSVNNVTLVIAGDGPDAEYLSNKAKELGLSDNVLFLGAVEHSSMPEYYFACDIFMQLSRIHSESFGLVYIEANACLRPAVGLNVGGVGESIEDGVSGLLLEQNDFENVHKVISLLNAPKATIEQLSQSGYNRAVKSFSIAAMSRKTLQLLKAYQ